MFVETKNVARVESLVMASLLLFLTGCFGPSLLYNKSIDVSKSSRWWGELATNRVVHLKADALVHEGKLEWLPVCLLNPDGSTRERVSVESYKANPGRWPEIRLVKEGARLKCVRLVRYLSVSSSRYRVTAEVLDGPAAGLQVEVMGIFGGNPYRNGKGTLQIARPERLALDLNSTGQR